MSLILVSYRHVIPGGLTWVRYHGKGRTSQPLDFGSNIVLKTYHTIAADWKNKGNSEGSVLHSTRWRRLVLDEGLSEPASLFQMVTNC